MNVRPAMPALSPPNGFAERRIKMRRVWHPERRTLRRVARNADRKLALMKTVKAVTNPDRILDPGRVLGRFQER